MDEAKTHIPGDRRTLHSISIEMLSSDDLEVSGASPSTTLKNESSLAMDKIPFFSGIPSVEVVKGLLHLYKIK